MLFAFACGGTAVLSEPSSTPSAESIAVQPIIVDVQIDDGVPEGITIELEDGTRLWLRLAESVSRDDWDRDHLDGHRRTRTRLFITYEERPGEFVATELSE